MYIALSIMLGGILLGRLFRNLVSSSLLRRLTMLSILLLLFLLGVSIGHNQEVLANLPTTGLNSLILMLFCVAGSILLSIFISPFVRNHFSDKKKPDK